MTDYCTTSDLLLGDLQLGSKVDPDEWIAKAVDEIDSHVGLRYETPLTGLARASELRIKRICAQLTSGRLLLALDNGTDDLHAYGRDLVQQALAEVLAIENGLLDLIGATTVDVAEIDEAASSRGPSVTNVDAYCATEAYEAHVHGDPFSVVVPEPWRPGP